MCSAIAVFGAANIGTYRQYVSFEGQSEPKLEVSSLVSVWIETRVPVFSGLELTYQSLRTKVAVLPVTQEVEFDLVWPEKIYRNEAFLLRAVARGTPQQDQVQPFPNAIIRRDRDPLTVVRVSLAIAGATVEPNEPQRIGSDGSLAWSIKFSDAGTQTGFLRVESEDEGVTVQTNELTSQVSVREELEVSYEGIFALVSGMVGFLIGLVGFIWKYRDRQRVQAVELAEAEAKKTKLILPGQQN